MFKLVQVAQRKAKQYFYRLQKASENKRTSQKEGPDYVKDHLPKVHQHTSYIGEKRPVLEKTGDLRYLWRSASNRSWPAKYKYEYVGGVGWGIQDYNFINKSRRESGFHIKHGELTLAAIDRVNHRYQNPWQPKPFILDKQGRHGRGFIAWNMSDYEDSSQRNSKWAVLVTQSKSLSPGASKPSKLPKLPKKEETLLIEKVSRMRTKDERENDN